MNLEWDIKIRKAQNGVMVAVGCKKFVFGKKDFTEFLSDLEGYLNDDIAIGKKYAPEMFEERNKCQTAGQAGQPMLRDYPVTSSCEPETFI
jgi:hypothetical protein